MTKTIKKKCVFNNCIKVNFALEIEVEDIKVCLKICNRLAPFGVIRKPCAECKVEIAEQTGSVVRI